MRNVFILVCSHKHDANLRKTSIYEPIQVGSAINDVNVCELKDNVGDNISVKNNNYCELTALYWLWKNHKEAGIVGLAHYRRYFEQKVTKEFLEKYIGKYHVIVLKPTVHPNSLYKELGYLISPEYVCILISIIGKLYPEYDESLQQYFCGNKVVPRNMFVASKEWTDNYCEWLFSILQSVELSLKEMPYTRQKRALGYMGEFLLGLYLLHNNYNVKYVNVDDCTNRTFKVILGANISKLSNSIAFHLQERRFVLDFANIIRRCLGIKPKYNIHVLEAVRLGLKNDGFDL